VLGLGVVAGAADDGVEGELEGAQELCGLLIGGSERSGWLAGAVAVVVGPGNPGVRSGGAAVGGGGAVGVQGGQAPAGVRIPGRRGYQVPGGLGVQEPESGGFSRWSGVAVQGGQGHGDVNQGG